MADALGRLRKLEDIKKLRAEMKILEHDGDVCERIVIARSYEVDVKKILGIYGNGSDCIEIRLSDLQKVFDAYNDERKRQEIAKLLESAIDGCERVFHVLGNIYLKYA